MLYALLVLLFYSVVAGAAVLLFWAAQIRFGDVSDLDPNSFLVRILRKKRILEPLSGFDSQIPQANVEEEVTPVSALVQEAISKFDEIQPPLQPSIRVLRELVQSKSSFETSIAKQGRRRDVGLSLSNLLLEAQIKRPLGTLKKKTAIELPSWDEAADEVPQSRTVN